MGCLWQRFYFKFHMSFFIIIFCQKVIYKIWSVIQNFCIFGCTLWLFYYSPRVEYYGNRKEIRGMVVGSWLIESKYAWVGTYLNQVWRRKIWLSLLGFLGGMLEAWVDYRYLTNQGLLSFFVASGHMKGSVCDDEAYLLFVDDELVMLWSFWVTLQDYFHKYVYDVGCPGESFIKWNYNTFGLFCHCMGWSYI